MLVYYALITLMKNLNIQAFKQKLTFHLPYTTLKGLVLCNSPPPNPLFLFSPHYSLQQSSFCITHYFNLKFHVCASNTLGQNKALQNFSSYE